MLLDVGLDGVVVAEFESCNVGGGVEEKRLTMASVLHLQQ